MSDFSGEAEQRRLGHNGVDIIDEFCEVRHQTDSSSAVQAESDETQPVSQLAAACRRHGQCSSRVNGFTPIKRDKADAATHTNIAAVPHIA